MEKRKFNLNWECDLKKMKVAKSFTDLRAELQVDKFKPKYQMTEVPSEIFCIPPKRVLHDAGNNCNLHTLITHLQKHHNVYNPSPDLFFCQHRLKMAKKISKAVDSLGKSKQGNRIIIGTRGIGKSLFFQKSAIALSAYSTLMPIYVNYNTCIVSPLELLKSACQLRNIELNEKSARSMELALIAVTSLGIRPIFFVDEVQKLYSASFSLVNEILNEFSILIDNVNTRIFLIGDCNTLFSKLINPSIFPDLPKLDPQLIKPTTMGPSSETEIEDYLDKIFVK